MPRNYQKSIVLHVILLLLILLFPFMSQSEDIREVEHVIVVDFSRNNSSSVMATPKSGASKATAVVKSKSTLTEVEKQQAATPVVKVNLNLQTYFLSLRK